jgi:hypothetical protein
MRPVAAARHLLPNRQSLGIDETGYLQILFADLRDKKIISSECGFRGSSLRERSSGLDDAERLLQGLTELSVLFAQLDYISVIPHHLLQ